MAANNLLYKDYFMSKEEFIEPEFSEIKNPYIIGNPIKSEDMFFGRKDDLMKIHELISFDGGFHSILLIGGHRSGKSSILHQINTGRFNDIAETVWCDFQASNFATIKNDERFLFEMGIAILNNPCFSKLKEAFLNEEDNISTLNKLQNLLENCLLQIAPKKIIFLFDEIEKLEELFKNKRLSLNALFWVQELLGKPFYFIITNSQDYKESNIKAIFEKRTIKKDIVELTKNDTFSLIKSPCQELYFDKDTLEKIYRLSGGFPFYVQLICGDLVNKINSTLKCTNIKKEDLDSIIKEQLESPHGHIQSTWSTLFDQSSKKIMLTLVIISNSIQNYTQYVNLEDLITFSQENNFFINKDDIRKSISWIKNNTRLLERKRKGYRFRTDLFRQWIAHEFQMEEDINEYINLRFTPQKQYESNIRDALIEGEINFEKRFDLDLIYRNLGLNKYESEDIEYKVRKEKIDWVKEYKNSCKILKDKYPNKIPREVLKRLRKVYIKNNRISKEKEKEINKVFKIHTRARLYVTLFLILIILLIFRVILNIINYPPVANQDTFKIYKNNLLKISPDELLNNDNDKDKDDIFIEAVMDGLHGVVTMNQNKIIFEPETDYKGKEAGFKYKLKDNRGGEAKGIVKINVVEPPNLYGLIELKSTYIKLTILKIFYTKKDKEYGIKEIKLFENDSIDNHIKIAKNRYNIPKKNIYIISRSNIQIQNNNPDIINITKHDEDRYIFRGLLKLIPKEKHVKNKLLIIDFRNNEIKGIFFNSFNDEIESFLIKYDPLDTLASRVGNNTSHLGISTKDNVFLLGNIISTTSTLLNINKTQKLIYSLQMPYHARRLHGLVTNTPERVCNNNPQRCTTNFTQTDLIVGLNILEVLSRELELNDKNIFSIKSSSYAWFLGFVKIQN